MNIEDLSKKLDEIGITLNGILYLSGASAVVLIAIYLTLKFGNK